MIGYLSLKTPAKAETLVHGGDGMCMRFHVYMPPWGLARSERVPRSTDLYSMPDNRA